MHIRAGIIALPLVAVFAFIFQVHAQESDSGTTDVSSPAAVDSAIAGDSRPGELEIDLESDEEETLVPGDAKGTAVIIEDVPEEEAAGEEYTDDYYEDEYMDEEQFYEEDEFDAENSEAGGDPGDQSAGADADTDSAVTISDSAQIAGVSSVNFADNLREYRSPKLAMFLSFIVPGLGQAYARNYWKAGVFAVAEAAIIGGALYMRYEGGQRLDEAHAFADSAFSIDSLRNYQDSLWRHFRSKYTGDADSLGSAEVDAKADDEFNTLYGDTSAFFQSAEDKSEAYYGYLDGKLYVQGWRDCEPTFTQMEDIRTGGNVETDTITGDHGKYLINPDPDSTWLVDIVEGGTGDRVEDRGLLGYSPNARTFRSMVSNANKYYRRSGYVVIGLIVSRVVSGIDAAISAVAHNQKLLGRQSGLERVRLHQELVFDSCFRMNYGVAWRF